MTLEQANRLLRRQAREWEGNRDVNPVRAVVSTNIYFVGDLYSVSVTVDMRPSVFVRALLLPVVILGALAHQTSWFDWCEDVATFKSLLPSRIEQKKELLEKTRRRVHNMAVYALADIVNSEGIDPQ